jgi:monofunctional biosynthetic peptidoglycan transglycosylase
LGRSGGQNRQRRRWRRRLLWLLVGALSLPWVLVAVLRFVDPPGSAFMLGYALQRDETAPPLRWHWVPLSRISPQLQIAVIAAEDQRFAEHAGFDLQAIRSALGEDARRGASTISQQVAKNLFLWSGRSWVRKGLEAGLTVCIETLWPKRRILEVYLNLAEFGPGVYGAEAAAQFHFGRPAAALGLHQSALLAATLPSPKRYSPRQPSHYLLRRVAWIERQVGQLGGVNGLRAIQAPNEEFPE